MEVTKQDLINSHNRIKPFIHNTPVLTSNYVNEITGAEVYFKCENFQKMGAFKMRGAANAILRLSDEQKVTELLLILQEIMLRQFHSLQKKLE